MSKISGPMKNQNMNRQILGETANSSKVKQSSMESTKSSILKKISSPAKSCLFCKKFAKYQDASLVINRALYYKYASSQNYYYTKEINDILNNARKKHVIYYKDLIVSTEEEEYISSYFNNEGYTSMIPQLLEYYKFHKEIPRLFMLPTTEVLNDYHNKKRRVEYKRIKEFLKKNKQEQGLEESSKEDSSSLKEKNPQVKPLATNDSKILAELESTYKHTQNTQNFNDKQDEKNEKTEKSNDKKDQMLPSNILEKEDVQLAESKDLNEKFGNIEKIEKRPTTSTPISGQSDNGAFSITIEDLKAYLETIIPEEKAKAQVSQVPVEKLTSKLSSNKAVSRKNKLLATEEENKNQDRFDFEVLHTFKMNELARPTISNKAEKKGKEIEIKDIYE